MARVIEQAGGLRAALGIGLAGLIGIAGIVVAVGLTSCEASSRSASRPTTRATTKSASVPRIDPAIEPRAATSSTHGATPAATTSTSPLQTNSMDASLPTSEPQMRVRIGAGVDTVRLTCPGGIEIGQGEPRGTTTLSPGAKTEKRSSVTVTLRNGQWQVSETGSGAAGAARTYSAALSIVAIPSVSGQMVIVNGTAYPGTLRLSARTEARADSFDVVDFVNIEEYLPGVVGKEMLVGWPLAAYQAQAVAARTYALHERQRSVGAPYDVESSDRDQVYGGATTNATAREAVKSTRGVVLMDGSVLLRTYYSSTCGGRTAAAKDTWPTGPGYEYNLAAPIQEHHRDFACQGSPLFRWSVERPRWELAQRLKWFGERNGHPVKKIKDIRSVDVAVVNSDGRPSKFRVAESSGVQYTLSAEELRLACNTNANGSLITLAPPDDNVPTVAIDAGDVMGFGGAGAAESAKAPLAAAVPLTVPDIDRRTRVHSSDFEITIKGDKATITGRGFGHGVGLCQYCAKGFAEKGEDWKTMLARFYPGARVTSMY